MDKSHGGKKNLLETKIIIKIINTFKAYGFIQTLKRIIIYLSRLPKRRIFERRVLNSGETEEIFTWIYKNNWWSNYESLSGSGSTLKCTENLRKELPKLIKDFNIARIFDAPCGDFNWMKVLLPTINVAYTGADIVQNLVDSNNSNYKSDKIKFLRINLITDGFPDADLMICRDCFFHLSYDDIHRVLKNFSTSNIPYFLVTTNKNRNNFQNTDIETGDSRLIDLFSSPFNFPSNPLARIDDWVPPEAEREMCLFSKEQILSILNATSH